MLRMYLYTVIVSIPLYFEKYWYFGILFQQLFF